MRLSLRRALCLALASSAVSSCTTTIEAARSASVRYNAAFADARNEILLVNILRARDELPLQFSTISTVTGPMRANIDLTSALEWVFHDKDKLTPSGTFTFRNPAVTLTPLESKEFLQGMTKPIAVDQLDELLEQGWDASAVLNLAVGAIQCPNETKIVNDGRDRIWVNTFENAASLSRTWRVGKTDKSAAGDFDVTAAEGAKIVKEGLGDDYSVGIAKKQANRKRMGLEVSQPGEAALLATKLGAICGRVGSSLVVEKTNGSEPKVGAKAQPKVFFRSPAAMIAYLGHLMNTAPNSQFFRVAYTERVSAMPATAPVRAVFDDYAYYIPSVREGGSRTLQTFAILTQIIALQTTQATLEASKPVLTIDQN